MNLSKIKQSNCLIFIINYELFRNFRRMLSILTVITFFQIRQTTRFSFLFHSRRGVW